MSDNTDYRSEIDNWAEMWDEMQDEGIHPEIEKPKPSPFASEYMGDTGQDTYYDYLDSEELLAEDKTQNPVYPDSVGADNSGPDPVWVSDKLLPEIEKLKDRLFKVENRMAQMGQGKKFSEKAIAEDKSLFGEIESIRKQIERVSSQLGIKEEPSPYKTTRG